MCCRGGFAVGVWASAVWVGAFRVSAVWGGSRGSGGVVWGMPLWIICGSIVGLLILAFLFTPP